MALIINPDSDEHDPKIKMKTNQFYILSVVAAVILSMNASAVPYIPDFSKQLDSNVWQLIGNPLTAYVDTTNQNLILTNNQIGQANIIWLNQEIKSDFTASFSYLNSGGGDGMVFMFYKDKNYVPGCGGSLTFDKVIPNYGFGKPVDGYGVEFDTIQNNDPDDVDPTPMKHIALIQNSAGNHLKWVPDNRVGDNQWHNVIITVKGNTITVNLGGSEVLTWGDTTTPPFDKTYGGIGIGAATGMATSWQIIKDLAITTGTQPQSCLKDYDCPLTQYCETTQKCMDVPPCTSPNIILDHHCGIATTYWTMDYAYNFKNPSGDPDASGGLCYGMSSTAILYFLHNKMNNPNDYPFYPLPVVSPELTWNLKPGVSSGHLYDTTDMESGHYNDVTFAIVFHQVFDPQANGRTSDLTDLQRYNKIKDSLNLGKPIIVALDNDLHSAGHAIVAYKLWIDQDKAYIPVYDPNQYPNLLYDYRNVWYLVYDLPPINKFEKYKGYAADGTVNVIDPMEPGMMNKVWFDRRQGWSWEALLNSHWTNTYLKNYDTVVSDAPIKIQDISTGGTARIDTLGNSQTFSTGIPGLLGFSEANIIAYALPKWISDKYYVDPDVNGSSFLFIYSMDNSTNITSEHSFYVEMNSSGSYYYTATPSNDSLQLNVSGANVSVTILGSYDDSANNTVFFNLTKTDLNGNVTLEFDTNHWSMTNISKNFIPSTLYLTKKGSPVPGVVFPTVKVKNTGNASLDSVYIQDQIPIGFYVPTFPAKDKGFTALAGSVLANVGSSDTVDQDTLRVPVFVFLESIKSNCKKNCLKLTWIPPRYYKAVLQGQNLTVDFSNISKSSIGRTLKGNESIIVSYAMFAQKDYVFGAGNLSTDTYVKSMDLSGLFEEKTFKQRLELVTMK